MPGTAISKRHEPGEGASISGPPPWPAWNYDTHLYRIYAKQIKKAFNDAIIESSGHITAWWRGELTTTRQGLLHMIGDSIEKAVGKVLYLLWTEAYFLGDRSAEAVAAHKAPDFGSWIPGRPETAEAGEIAGHIQHLLAAYGISLIQSITSTKMRELGEEISNAVAKGEGPEDLIERLPRILLTDMRSDAIARTETLRGISAAAIARYKRMGATHKSWQLSPRSCRMCQKNYQEGMIPLDSVFTSGDFTPPAHPGCRCATVGYIPSQPPVKKQYNPERHAEYEKIAHVLAQGHSPETVCSPLIPQYQIDDIAFNLRRGLTADEAIEQVKRAILGEDIFKRRRVGLDGSMLANVETGIYHSEPGAGFSGNNVQQPPNQSGPGWGGGGQQMRPHDATGRQYEDIPGASWGSEPPRWDYGPAGPGGAFNNGDLNRVPGADLWPEGGTGTAQSPSEWDVQQGRNSFYVDIHRQPADVDDESDPHPQDDEDDVPEDEDDSKFPGFQRGRSPNSVGKRKSGKPWKNKNLPIDERIYRQLSDDYPPRAINWVRDVTWKEPQKIPTAKIDYSNEENWKASHHGDRVDAMTEKIKNKENGGKHSKPMVLVKSPGNSKYVVIDGHHRALAYRKAGIPAWGYIALVSKNKGPWLNTHHMQNHDSGDITGSKDLTKNAANYSDPNPVEAEHVMNQMRANYPEDSINWVKNAHWIGPVKLPVDRIDFGGVGKWAAFHQPERVKQFKKLIQQGETVNPIIAVQTPGDDKAKVVDGHHRSLAFKELGKPIPAYVGIVHSDSGPWDKTHLYQVHQGADPQNKRKKPRTAGIIVRAKDTGRVLMLQRHLDD